MRICYYVTGHGYGHAIRTAQIIKALPEDVSVILRTVVPLTLFQEEAPSRDFLHFPAQFDCGCLQSDSVTVLPRETLDRYRELSAANQARLPEEVQFLQSQNVDLVVSDIPSFPLHVAHDAGLPGFSVANFTWHDIYRSYQEGTEDVSLLAQMAAEYAMATLAFVTPLSTPGVRKPFPRVQEVPLVARKGNRLREKLQYQVGNGTRLALLYFGTWGLDMNWDALGRLHDWTFLTYEPPAYSVPANVVTLNRDEWRYADAAASVDVVVSKAGYGIVTECIANSIPLIYLPRTGFAEYQALVAGMEPWGGGVQISEQDFKAGRWELALDRSQSLTLNRSAYGVDGAQVIAAHLIRSAGV